MRRLTFVNKEYYHIYNRGVEKRDIFCEYGDYLRCIHYLYELNDRERLSYNLRHCFHLYEAKPRGGPEERERDTIVEIIAYCLMPNHFHLILRQIQSDGISQFMQKLGTAWTMFFNAKYERSGRLFQGVFKARHVKTTEQFIHLTRYIHLNPLNIIFPGWRKRGVSDWLKVNNFLEQYRWSSYLDYLGKKNFPLVIAPEPLKMYFNNALTYKDFVNDLVLKDLENITDILIEK